MHVSDIMTSNPQSCAPTETLHIVASRMRDGDFGSMPVVGADGHMVGIVTDRDIAIRAVAQGLGPETPVAQVMTADPVCVSPSIDLEEAAEIMQAERIRRLYVTDDEDALIGVMALADVVLAQDEELSADTLAQISAITE